MVLGMLLGPPPPAPSVPRLCSWERSRLDLVWSEPSLARWARSLESPLCVPSTFVPPLGSRAPLLPGAQGQRPPPGFLPLGSRTRSFCLWTRKSMP
ncbi:hypothetical protein P7K49_020641, partial [Saguinus oedipus]